MLWHRERYLAHMLGEYTGCELLCELFGPLMTLEDEWRQQGASEKEIAMTAFDWDYVPTLFTAGSCSALTRISPHIISDSPYETISIDEMGRMVRLIKKSATIPLPMEYPVKTMDDWLRIKKWYEFSEERIDSELLKYQHTLRENGHIAIQAVPGAFDEPRQLMGEEALCIACYEEPELIMDMLDTISATAIRVIERVGDVMPIDIVHIHEDMAGKSGPLFGPKQVYEFMQPYYLKIWDCAKSYGAQLFSQDSDGNMEPILDALIDCGVNCTYPCEPNSGMDIVSIRKKYGRKLCLKGGIDKFALRKDFAAIRRELEYKTCDIMRGGGTVFALDHRIPNGVPIENYRYYVNTLREMLGRAPISGEGWARMAF